MNKLLSIIFLGILMLAINSQAASNIPQDVSIISGTNTEETTTSMQVNSKEENTQDLLDTVEDTITDISDLASEKEEIH